MHRKKLFYVPGLISLLGLPVLLFFLGPEDPVYKTVLKMNLPADKPRSDGGLSFNKVDFLRMIKHKQLISVDIDDSPSDDLSQYESDRKLAFIPRELERLQFTNDTNAVFRLRFGQSNTYAQFIWAINMAIINDFKRYAFIDADFYFLPNPPPERIILEMDVLPSYGVGDLPPYTPPTWWELFTRRFSFWWSEVLYDIRHSYWLVTGFVLLILVPGVVGVRRLRLRS